MEIEVTILQSSGESSIPMNKLALLFFTSASLAAAYILWRRSPTPPRIPPLRRDDLYYSHLSPHELTSRHLIDLNAADDTQLHALGLDAESLQRLLDNRPYRSKLELVSRMILSEDAYAKIKHRIGVARGDEPVKTA